MEKTLFKLKINIPNLDGYLSRSTDPCAMTYLSELIINEKEDTVSIKIFYSDKEYLGEKISRWNHNSEHDLLDHFETIEALSPDVLGSIDFTGFKCIGISNGLNDYERIDPNESALKFTTITTTGIRVKFTDVTDDLSHFYLNSAGFPLVEMNYKYPIIFPWEETPFTWEPKNLVEDYIVFDKIRFKPEHHLYRTTKHESAIVSIQKDPRLAVRHENLTEEEIRKQVTMICALLSFYSHTEVEYFVAKTFAKDGRFYERKQEKKIDGSGHGIFMWDFSRNPLNLVVNINATRLMTYYDFVMNIITRYTYAMQLSGESKFMILYNVLEQIRVQYILEKKIEQDKAGDPPQLKKVIQEYEFTKDDDQVKKIIKEALGEVAKIIKENHQEEFKKEISTKAKNIKLMSMVNQFKSLFVYTNLEPSICNLDFDIIKKLRNKIFHGNSIDEADANYIDKICKHDRFPRFVGLMMLHYFGIPDLTQIEKKYR